jgi:protein O-mannosyl-transferase
MAKQDALKKKSVQKTSAVLPAQPHTQKRKIALFVPLAGILLLAFIIYLKSLKNGFTNYDDDVLILNNSLVQNLSWGNIYAAFFSYLNGMYHPLVTISWAIEYNLLGAALIIFI